MRRYGILAALAGMALPQAALAQIYTFHSTELSALSPSPSVFDFTLDAATATAIAAGTSFGNVTISHNGVATTGNTLTASFGTNIGGSPFFLVDTSPDSATRPFYSGSGPAITFNPGVFAIADGLTNGKGTLTIGAVAVSAVPEATTWAAMLLGFGLIGARMRRRRTVRLRYV